LGRGAGTLRLNVKWTEAVTSFNHPHETPSAQDEDSSNIQQK